MTTRQRKAKDDGCPQAAGDLRKDVMIALAEAESPELEGATTLAFPG
jgi:hypothetical protein